MAEFCLFVCLYCELNQRVFFFLSFSSSSSAENQSITVFTAHAVSPTPATAATPMAAVFCTSVNEVLQPSFPASICSS